MQVDLTNEQFYDQEIAPQLKLLMNKCAERNMPFIAVVEFEHEQCGLTADVPESASVWVHLVLHAYATKGNLDAFVIRVVRWAQERKISIEETMIGHLLKGRGS